MRDSDHAPHFHRPEHFYRTQRGAQNRGNPTPLIEERLRHSRPADQREVMFVATYEGEPTLVLHDSPELGSMQRG